MVSHHPTSSYICVSIVVDRIGSCQPQISYNVLGRVSVHFIPVSFSVTVSTTFSVAVRDSVNVAVSMYVSVAVRCGAHVRGRVQSYVSVTTAYFRCCFHVSDRGEGGWGSSPQGKCKKEKILRKKREKKKDLREL